MAGDDFSVAMSGDIRFTNTDLNNQTAAGWPEARLIACGTERMDKETFTYETKTPGQIYRHIE